MLYSSDSNWYIEHPFKWYQTKQSVTDFRTIQFKQKTQQGWLVCVECKNIQDLLGSLILTFVMPE